MIWFLSDLILYYLYSHSVCSRHSDTLANTKWSNVLFLHDFCARLQVSFHREMLAFSFFSFKSLLKYPLIRVKFFDHDF